MSGRGKGRMGEVSEWVGKEERGEGTLDSS